MALFFQRQAGRCRRGSNRRPGSTRLVLEILEDRSLPSAVLNAAGATPIVPPANHDAGIANEFKQFNPKELNVEKPTVSDKSKNSKSDAPQASFSAAFDGNSLAIGATSTRSDNGGNGNADDLEFVRERAARIDYEDFGNDTNLLFHHRP